ncbi:MAG: gamma-glutamylcyclotransferase [Phycisphaeraceae bacterium]|nr:gamma-glutamylcyclotransferase [Phycisphaeraceae bacterium]
MGGIGGGQRNPQRQAVTQDASPPWDRRELFVYGTLRRGGVNHRLIASCAVLVGEAVMPGRLVIINWYPGLVDPVSSADRVVGEVYRLHPGDTAAMDRLDAYEGCGPRSPLPHEFTRVPREVTMADGQARWVWVYRFAGPVDGRRVLASGDFLRPA